MDSMKNTSIRQLLEDFLMAEKALKNLEVDTHPWLRAKRAYEQISKQLDILINQEADQAPST